VGHGDSSLIQYRGLNVLVDSGTAYSNVYTYLLSHGVTHLDYVVFSHRHDDHIGGFEMIAKNLEINAVICLSDVQDMIESKGIACRFLPPSGTVTYGDLILNFDYAISETDANDNGTLVHLNLHHFDAVFAGDFSGKTLSSFHLPEDIDFLKVPHHGSITGYNEDFFSEHHTDVAVISQNRRYFMPATAVVDAYRSEGAKVFTTFQNGEISFLVNDHQLRAVDYYGNKYKATFDMEADG
jgi:competence protein ComEC